MKIRFYEDDIKDLILRKKHLFVPEGMGSAVVFEKALVPSRSDGVDKRIADCLIFREDGIIIGVEIKTERDSLSRLRSQLPAYSLVCDYVYVMCHDKHIDKVEQSTKRYKQQHVGIMAYTEFKSIPMVGTYRKAQISPTCTTKSAYNLLWKAEILRILSAFKRPSDTAARELGFNNTRFKHRGIGMSNGLSGSGNSKSMTKGQLINNLLIRLGDREARKVLCDVFINHRMDPERTIKLRHFHPTRRKEEEPDG